MRSSMLRLCRDGRIRSRAPGSPFCLNASMTLRARFAQRAQACFATGIPLVTSGANRQSPGTPADPPLSRAASDRERPAPFTITAWNWLHQTS